MKPAVRQMRGPGMNKGLKKPRHAQIKKPQPFKPPKEFTERQSAKTSSYLPQDGAGGKPKRPRSGKKLPPFL